MSEPTKKQPFVLIGEDDPFFSKVYALTFPKAGMEVQIAKNGEELLEMARARTPDLILLDLVMPKKDGFQALTELRSDAKLKKIKVLITSSLKQKEDKEKVEKLGVEGFYHKSNIQEIVDAAKKFVS
jgi:CheY-like chemotaxis protein